MSKAIASYANTGSKRFVVPAWLTLEGVATESDIAWLNNFDPFLPIDHASRIKFEDIYSKALTFILALPNSTEILQEHFN